MVNYSKWTIAHATIFSTLVLGVSTDIVHSFPGQHELYKWYTHYGYYI